MTTKSSEFRQDMPPPGGYRTFNWERTFPKRILKPIYVMPALTAALFYSIYESRGRRRGLMNRVFEDRDIHNALEPFLKAERDREWLKHVRKIREMEDEIMKDVPGWVTGTWYGEPVYFTLGEKWWDPISVDFFIHSEDHAVWQDMLWRHIDGYSAPKFYDKWLPHWIKKYCW